MGAHETVRDELVHVIKDGRKWRNVVSEEHAGGAPGVATRPHTYPASGSQNWNNMAWVGEGLGHRGFDTMDTWHHCALSTMRLKGATRQKASQSIGLFNTEVGSSIYDRWTAASTFLAAVPDARGKCAEPSENTQTLARRVNAAYAAFFALHAVDEYPEFVHASLHKIMKGEKRKIEIKEWKTKIEPDKESLPLPWIVAAQNRGVAKNNGDKWPHCSNPNGWWLALALDWRDENGKRVKPAKPKPDGADWWLWAMQEIAQKKYAQTWPAEWFGLTEEDRHDLRQFIRTDGKEGQDTLLSLAGNAPVRNQFSVKRWRARLLSWIPTSSNGNNPAVLVAEWHRKRVYVYAPSFFFTGKKPISRGKAEDDVEDRRVRCSAEKGVKLESNLYPKVRPTVHFEWSQQRGLRRVQT